LGFKPVSKSWYFSSFVKSSSSLQQNHFAKIWPQERLCEFCVSVIFRSFWCCSMIWREKKDKVRKLLLFLSFFDYEELKEFLQKFFSEISDKKQRRVRARNARALLLWCALGTIEKCKKLVWRNQMTEFYLIGSEKQSFKCG